MKQTSTTERIIFGLKAKQLRQKNRLSFAELAAATGMSLSYLNEIEKGKKFPKQDKIEALATALGTTAEELTDGHLGRHLAPVENLLRSNFLNELPLDLFGIELSKVVELVAGAPVRVAAFISTLLELSRSYNVREENFYFAALRSYLELHDNFFPEIESEVEAFAERYEIAASRPLTPKLLEGILEKQYGYTIVPEGLPEEKELERLRSIFLPKSKKLLLQNGLKSHQASFQFGKELAFNYLKLGERAKTSSLFNARSFEEVLNHSRATYFSAALQLPLKTFGDDIAALFAEKHWEATAFTALMSRYNVNPETLYHRLTNIIPHRFGFSDLFFLRFVHTPDSSNLVIDRELHLNGGRYPRGNSNDDYYGRCWISASMLLDIQEDPTAFQPINDANIAFRVQRSTCADTDINYLCFTLVRQDYPSSGKHVSNTLGLAINAKLKDFCNWLDDSAVPTKTVNVSNQQYSIIDVNKRIVKPEVLGRKGRIQRIQERIEALDKE